MREARRKNAIFGAPIKITFVFKKLTQNYLNSSVLQKIKGSGKKILKPFEKKTQAFQLQKLDELVVTNLICYYKSVH